MNKKDYMDLLKLIGIVVACNLVTFIFLDLAKTALFPPENANSELIKYSMELQQREKEHFDQMMQEIASVRDSLVQKLDVAREEWQELSNSAKKLQQSSNNNYRELQKIKNQYENIQNYSDSSYNAILERLRSR